MPQTTNRTKEKVEGKTKLSKMPLAQTEHPTEGIPDRSAPAILVVCAFHLIGRCAHTPYKSFWEAAGIVVGLRPGAKLERQWVCRAGLETAALRAHVLWPVSQQKSDENYGAYEQSSAGPEAKKLPGSAQPRLLDLESRD